MVSVSLVLIIVNVIFLSLGALLYLYYDTKHILPPTAPDMTFVDFALYQTKEAPYIGIIFILGIIATAFSTADSALTALTTSFQVDFIPVRYHSVRNRVLIHLGFAFILFLVVLTVKAFASEQKSLIDTLFIVAGYTYGPLLGMFLFCIFTTRVIRYQVFVPVICVLSPVISYLISINSTELFGGYQLGQELIVVNTLIAMGALFFITQKNQNTLEA
jgi:hypothetical protein